MKIVLEGALSIRESTIFINGMYLHDILKASLPDIFLETESIVLTIEPKK